MLASFHEDVERLTMLLWGINSVSLVSKMENKDLKLFGFGPSSQTVGLFRRLCEASSMAAASSAGGGEVL